MAYKFGMGGRRGTPVLSGLPRRQFAAATARNNRELSSLVELTFFADTTWVAKTSNLVSVTGKGADGAPQTYEPGTVSVMVCLPNFSQSGGITKSKAAASIEADVDAGAFTGSTATRTVQYYKYTNDVGTDNLVQDSVSTLRTSYVQGTAVIRKGSTSGDITYSDALSCFTDVDVDIRQLATTGADTTGFGLTFNGGVSGPSAPSSYENVVVSYGAPYELKVPVGGSLTISYCEIG